MDSPIETVKMPAGIRNKLMAAACMLMVSAIMMVSSTYAWFTLSTAPEVKNITTTVAGNGSLEIALMPASGMLSEITAGVSSESGEDAVLTANTKWGNIVQLNDASYGLSQVTLNPAALNYTEATEDAPSQWVPESPLATAEYGYDGRIDVIDGNTVVKSKVNADGSEATNGFGGTGYGVRAIGNPDATGAVDSTYGYVVDLAFRLNTGDEAGNAGNLLLQTEAVQRIYDGTETTNTATMGGGSYMSFNNNTGIDMEDLMSAIRVTFVQNYGANGAAPIVLGTARLDVTNLTNDGNAIKAGLYMWDDAADTAKTDDNAVILSGLTKNTAQQVSALVWLDGEVVTNASVTAAQTQTVLQQSTLNLQFSTNVDLKPAPNNALQQGNVE